MAGLAERIDLADVLRTDLGRRGSHYGKHGGLLGGYSKYAQGKGEGWPSSLTVSISVHYYRVCITDTRLFSHCLC